MAIEGTLDGLSVGADHTVIMTIYTSKAKTAIQDSTGWTVVLDIRLSDLSTAPAKLSVTGTVSGVFNSLPGSNTQKWSFAIPQALITPAIFKGDDPYLRYSFWRTDTGTRQPLRFGSTTVNRTTQA